MPFDARTFPEAPPDPALHPHAAEIAIVDRMAQLLATPDRWCQGIEVNYRDNGNISYCLIGSLRRAQGIDPVGRSRYNAAGRGVAKVLSKFTNRKITGFNDEPATTHADILDLLARVRGHFEAGGA